ncbi:MAG: molybdopterin cofactor-binding domain-containing protein [Gammaproteobacteria bacterium]
MQNRRDFLKTLGIASTGLVIEISLSGCSTRLPEASDAAFQPNAWLQITPDNQIIYYLCAVEMGQGTMTGMTTLIAEELNTAPHLITVKTAPVNKAFINPVYGVQVTGGSTSVRNYYTSLRIAGAQAREMLRAAAALQLETNPDTLDLRDGHVIHRDTRIPFGQFAQSASRLSLPDVELKADKDFRFIGKHNARLDAQMKVRGTGLYGIDAKLPDLAIAALKRCPVNGGTVKSWQLNGADQMPRVKAVVEIPTGVAVLADSFWHAQKALEKITVDWDLPPLAKRSTPDIKAEFNRLLDEESGRSALSKGDADDAIEDAAKQVSARYTAPYLAHATMEPMNCTVLLTDERCDIWAPTQATDVSAAIAEEVTGLRRSNIHIHTTLIGGGFGRRLNVDYVLEATQIAKASGLPVKLVFSREDDTRHDFYRPAAHTQMRAGLDRNNRIIGWQHKNVCPTILAYTAQEMAPAVLPAWLPDGMVRASANMGASLYGPLLADPPSSEGAIEYGYDVDDVEVRVINTDPGLRTGFWRSVGHSFNAFMIESFMDELAHQAGQDPVEFRLRHLQGNPRMARVLKLAAEKGGWGTPSAPGVKQGIAVHPSFGSYVAQLVEIKVENGDIKLHRVVVAADCGKLVNPDIVTMQMESGVIFGLTAALKGDITLKDGAVQQGNFGDYPLLRLNEAPLIEVHLVQSQDDPGGVGEPGVPPAAPALANAIFAATGQRQRDLPLRLS